MDLIEEINKICNWWYKLPPDFTGISEVDYQLQRLSGLYYSYSSVVAKSYGKHLSSYVAKRIGVVRAEIKLYGTEPQSKAEKIALSESEMLLIDDISKEAEYYEHRLRLQSVGKIMDAMRSRIASLRKEQQ